MNSKGRTLGLSSRRTERMWQSSRTTTRTSNRNKDSADIRSTASDTRTYRHEAVPVRPSHVCAEMTSDDGSVQGTPRAAKPRETGTAHALPLLELDPSQFERLCLGLV